jgi:hypothetical protein
MHICFLAVILSFNAHAKTDFSEQSISYQVKWVKNNHAARFAECVKLLELSKKAANKFDFLISKCDKLWVLATAIVESGLNNKLVSPKGARSSMQTYRKYAPPECQSRKCDLRMAGIYHAIRYKHNNGLCDAATKYNRNPNAKCLDKSRGYAFNVMNMYYQLWEEEGLSCLGDMEKGC